MSKPDVNLPLIDVKIVNDNLKSMKGFLDKGFKSGQYNIEEAEQVLQIMNNLQKVNETLDMYQRYVVALMKRDKDTTS